LKTENDNALTMGNSDSKLAHINKTFLCFKNSVEFVTFFSTSKNVKLKEKLICELSKNKDVLDIGCIGHSYETALSLGDSWLHKQLKDVSKSIVGIDSLGEDARKLNKMGFNIISANAESFNLNRTFDVIVAGDLIEHVSNIGLFLARIEMHMHSNSICIITTPNPFNIEQVMLAIFENHIAVNDEHTTWLDPKVMYETISRTNLHIVDFHWIETRFRFRVSKRSVRYLANSFSYNNEETPDRQERLCGNSEKIKQRG